MKSLMVFLNEVFRASIKRPVAAFGIAIGNLFFIIAGAIVPLLVGEVIALATPEGSQSLLAEVVGLWAAIMVFWLLAEWVLAWSAASIIATYSDTMRTQAVDSLYLDPFSQPDVGGITTRLTSDIDAIEEPMLETLIGSITDFGRLLIVCAALMVISPAIGSLFILFLVLFVVFQLIVSKPVDRANDERQTAVDVMSGKVSETVRTLPVIEAYDLQAWDSGRFREHSTELRRATRHRVLMGWWPYWIGASTGQIALLVILPVAAIVAQRGMASVAEVAATMMYVQSAVASVNSLAKALPAAQKAGASVARIHELMRTTAMHFEITSPTGEVTGEAEPVEIALRDVSISLPSGRTLLQPTTIDLQAGQWTSLVGGSGAGKSTILGLITGQRRPTSGEVLVGGTDVDSAHRDVRTSLVFQDSLLFNASIAENIRAGDRTADDDALQGAAALAELDAVIAELPDGYATLIDTTGHIISGGQRQRLALARALVRKPQLLLLDEATSALDPQTATAVWRTMRRVAKERGITVVAVCHQLELAADSDQIVVMQSGAIVEKGTPRELSHAYGPWRELVDSHRRVVENDLESVMRLMGEHPELIPNDPELLADLARQSRVSDAPAGEVVCQRGDPLDAVVLISSGRMEVNDGTSRYVLGPGSALGNLNDLVTGRVAVDARMVTGGQLVLISRQALLPSLLDLLDSDPTTAAALAWLTRVESAPREEVAARIGVNGDQMIEGLIRGGALKDMGDGRIGVIVGKRRRMRTTLLDDLIKG